MNKDFGDGSMNVEATSEEQEAFKKYLKCLGKKPDEFLDIDVPYVVTVGAAVITGILHIRDPAENTSTDGVIAGVVVGTYHLDKNQTENSFYDPTGAVFRVDLKVSFNDKTAYGRFCKRNIFNQWKCDGWVLLASW